MEFIIPIIIIFIVAATKGKRRENEGEKKVREVVKTYCAKSGSYVMNNVTLKFGDGTTQIDHILITRKGILIIETKNYKGWIFGQAKDKKWTQVLYKKNYHFQNPLRQNYKHILAVQEVLHWVPDKFVGGAVVFTKDAEFKRKKPDCVLTLKQLHSFIKYMNYGTMTEKAMKYCIGCLEYERFELTRQTDTDHQNYLKKKFGEA